MDASSLFRRVLFYMCCCRSSEESSELCPEWEDQPVGGRGRSVEEGESEVPCQPPKSLLGIKHFCVTSSFHSSLALR